MRFAFLAWLALAFLGASPAVGKKPTPPPIRPQDQQNAEMLWPGLIMERVSTRETEETLRKFAQCLVEEKAPEVRTLLALPADSDKIYDDIAALVGGENECSPTFHWITNGSSIRYALIEVLYSRDFHGPGNGIPSVQFGSDAGKMEEGQCIVRSAASAADALTMTAPASKEQKAAFAALAPAVQSCGGKVPHDQEAQRWLRYEITEALYRQRSATIASGAVR